MDANARSYLTELVGTYLLVLVGAGTFCSTYLTGFHALGGVTLAIALAEGLTLAVVVTMTSRLSPACCNPALTLTLWVTKQIDGQRALLLGVAQLAGSFLAALTLRILFVEDVLVNARMGVPRLGAIPGSEGGLAVGSLLTGIGLEALFTFLVAIAAYASLIDPRGPHLGGLFVGLAQVAVILFGLHLTGGAANPARYFGPALMQLSLGLPDGSRPLAEHSIYWVGPVLGALAGCVFYSSVLRPPVNK